MRLGSDDKKKLITLGVSGFFAIFALYFIYSQFFGGPTTPPPAAPVIINAGPAKPVTAIGPNRTVTAPPGFATAGAAQKLGSTSGALDPTLHMDAMLRTEALVYSGTGRNIFAAGPAPAPPVQIVKANFAARPQPQQQIPQPIANPCPPVCPPPPINLKFFGTSTSASGDRKAFLLQGDDVFLASAGDVVQRKYRVISISPTTILIEDIPNTNKQTLPLIPN